MNRTIVILLLIFLYACVKREMLPLIPDGPPEQGEVITKVMFYFTDSATTETTSVIFSDPDGPGGNEPLYQSPDGGSLIKLMAGHTYQCELMLLDVSGEETDTVSAEVLAEGDEHMIFYDEGQPLSFLSLSPCTIQMPVGASIIYEDSDGASPPLGIGLKTRWRCSDKGETRLRVTLKHQPVKNGRYQEGETDMEVHFDLGIR